MTQRMNFQPLYYSETLVLPIKRSIVQGNIRSKISQVLLPELKLSFYLHWGSCSSSGSASLRSSSGDRDWWIRGPRGNSLVEHNGPADNVVGHVEVEVLLSVAH